MSKEVEEAIENLIRDKYLVLSGCSTAIFSLSDIETLLGYVGELEQKISKAIKRIEDLRQYFDEDVQADFVLILDILDGRLSK